MLEPADPLNYAAMIMGRAGAVPAKHLFVSEGVIDHYTPNLTTHALATALQIPLASPVVLRRRGLALRGLDPAALPLTGNLGRRTKSGDRGLLQYRTAASGQACTGALPCAGTDYCEEGVCRAEGHFVIFTTRAASSTWPASSAPWPATRIPTLGP